MYNKQNIPSFHLTSAKDKDNIINEMEKQKLQPGPKPRIKRTGIFIELISFTDLYWIYY